jgi:hypothetical protein
MARPGPNKDPLLAVSFARERDMGKTPDRFLSGLRLRRTAGPLIMRTGKVATAPRVFDISPTNVQRQGIAPYGGLVDGPLT